MGKLYDPKTDKFTRGEFRGMALSHVVRKDPGYILFLAQSGCSDEETTSKMRNFIESYPKLFEGVKKWGTPSNRTDLGDRL